MITPSAALTIDTVSRAEKRTRSRASSNCDALEKTCVNAMAKIKDTRTLTCWNICQCYSRSDLTVPRAPAWWGAVESRDSWGLDSRPGQSCGARWKLSGPRGWGEAGEALGWGRTRLRRVRRVP